MPLRQPNHPVSLQTPPVTTELVRKWGDLSPVRLSALDPQRGDDRARSGTDWEHAGIPGATVTAVVIRGLVERDAANRLTLTEQGRAALDELLAG
jgi:hypothetical protein